MNEKYMNEKTLGELLDGYRIFMDNSLSGYIIEPFPNREGCKVFYANITEASDIPFWAFKRFCQEKVIGVFERILSRMATFDLKNEEEIKVINTYSNIEPSF